MYIEKVVLHVQQNMYIFKFHSYDGYSLNYECVYLTVKACQFHVTNINFKK